jgi:hypothetical protein
MMKVDIVLVKRITEQRNKINSIKLSKIDWYQNGKKINIDQSTIEDFEIIGLNNTDFITTGFYRTGWNCKDKNHSKSMNHNKN